MSEFSKTVCGSPAKETTDKAKGAQMRKILVNEIYGPVKQGEGRTAGKTVKFLRTSGCNLACVWCDTPFTWNWEGTKFQHPEKFDKKKETHEMTVQEVKAQLDALGQDIKALVISGGEPMLQQQRLLPLVQALRADGYWLEIETNGTVMPQPEFLRYIDQINVSPKLQNSGTDNDGKRERPEVLSELAQLHYAIFKFVVSGPDDMNEILDLVNRYKLQNVYLMPLGKTRVEQLANQDLVQRISKEHNFSFSPRLHVLEYDNLRGV